MKKLVIDIIVVVLPIISVLIAVNYLGDPAHKFDDNYEQRIVELMRNGDAVTNVENCDERKLKRLIIKHNRGKHYEYIIFGSSRCMTISEKQTGKTLLNLGVSGATIQDFLSLLELCNENHISYDKVIICVDPALFNDKNTDNRWKTNAKWYAKITGGKYIDITPTEPWYKTLISGSYFQSSFKILMKNGKEAPLITAQKEENINQTNFPDGSITYGEVYRSTPQKAIDSFASHALRSEFSSYISMSSDYQHLFDLFLKKATDKHQSVTFVTFPYLKGYYDKLIAVSGVKQQELYIKNLASQNHYPDYGSLNPDDAGVSNNDFYDELHLRRNAIGKLCKDYNIFN